jgi:hypothetical protein
LRYPFFVSSVAGLVLWLALPSTSAAQVRQRAGGNAGGSQAIPRNGAPPPPATPPPEAVPAAPSGQAVSRTAAPTVEPADSGSSQNQGAKPRNGRPTTGTAVPRGSVPPRVTVVAPTVQYYRANSPWGFGGLGFDSFGSFYDPYVFYDPYSPWYGGYGGYGSYGSLGVYGYPPSGYGYPSSYSRAADGALRLKIKPPDAQVFVDGYYVGIVDEFDGVFERLHLPSGAHRIEVRAPGYETLTFDVQIRFGQTTKYQGDLRRTE